MSIIDRIRLFFGYSKVKKAETGQKENALLNQMIKHGIEKNNLLKEISALLTELIDARKRIVELENTIKNHDIHDAIAKGMIDGYYSCMERPRYPQSSKESIDENSNSNR